MNYGSGQAEVTREQRPLESLASAAQRVNTVTVRISSFLDRFNGVQPEATKEVVSGDLPPGPYCDSLQRLLGALDRLETRVEALDLIG